MPISQCQPEQSLLNRTQSDKPIRLDKYITSQKNDISRSDIKNIVRKGRICVNGRVEKSCDTKINPLNDIVTLDGEEIGYRKYIYIMLNKPQGVVCSTRDGLSPTVLSLVPPELMRKGLFPAGRLDKDTEGFVLLTDDGELAHRMLSPKSHVPKVYYVELEKDAQPDYVRKFKEGIILSDGVKCLPAEIYLVENEPKKCYVVLHEGMFHQVKNMFHKMSNKVLFLKRIQIGGLPLNPILSKGECIEILHKDVVKLLETFEFTLPKP